jgi:hypothetical protein
MKVLVKLNLYSPGITFSTTWMDMKNSTFSTHSAFRYFVWISEQTRNTSLYSINLLVFVTERFCVYFPARTEYIYIYVYMCVCVCVCVYIYIYIYIYVQIVANMLGQNAEENSSTPKQGKKLCVSTCPHTVFEVQPKNVWTSIQQIFNYGGTQKPLCIHLQLKMKTHFTNALLKPVTPSTTTPPKSIFRLVHACIDSSGDILNIFMNFGLINN